MIRRWAGIPWCPVSWTAESCPCCARWTLTGPEVMASCQCLLAKESTLQGKASTKKRINTGQRMPRNQWFLQNWKEKARCSAARDHHARATHRRSAMPWQPVPWCIRSPLPLPAECLRLPLAPSITSAMCRGNDSGHILLWKSMLGRGATAVPVPAWRRQIERCAKLFQIAKLSISTVSYCSVSN
jgi:hypothetical protein